jgi:hypothetical protein
VTGQPMLIDPLRSAYYRLPQRLQRAILVRRRERIWIDSGLVFVHIPKAAGTSINLALYGQFMGHVRAADIAQWGSAKLQALPSFAVTRNPWDRLVSAYRFVRRGRGLGGGFQATVRGAGRFQRPQFDTFDSFVTRWLSKQDVGRLDEIFQPQSAFVCDAQGNLLVDHVGRVENLEPTYGFIREHLGRVPMVEQANRSGDRVDYSDFYTPELAKLVGTIYCRDVEMFGYQF